MVAFYLSNKRDNEENKEHSSNKIKEYFQIISGTGDGKCFPIPHCFVLRRTSRSSPLLACPKSKPQQRPAQTLPRQERKGFYSLKTKIPRRFVLRRTKKLCAPADARGEPKKTGPHEEPGILHFSRGTIIREPHRIREHP
jgi:hypothetical protein